MKYGLGWLAGLVLVGIFIWFFPPGTWLVPALELDGQFNDWRGRTALSDAAGDGRKGNDFKKLAWSTNENDEKLYFMLERHLPESEDEKLEACLFFDLNNNGIYTDKVDKYAQIFYQPRISDLGEVTVYLYNMEGKLEGTYAGLWGEGSKENTSRLEFALPMQDLKVYPAQLIRFYLADLSGQGDRLPDQGDIQWAPFPIVSKSRPTLIFFFIVISFGCYIIYGLRSGFVVFSFCSFTPPWSNTAWSIIPV